jgi:hypothetical protein
LLISAFALWFAPIFLQAPVAALNLAPLEADISAVEVAMQSRLYYLSIVGAAIFFAVVLSVALARLQVEASRLRAAAMLSLILMVATFGSAAYRTTTDYGLRSSEIGQLARAAVASIAGVDLPAQNCHGLFPGRAAPAGMVDLRIHGCDREGIEPISIACKTACSTTSTRPFLFRAPWSPRPAQLLPFLRS